VSKLSNFLRVANRLGLGAFILLVGLLVYDGITKDTNQVLSAVLGGIIMYLVIIVLAQIIIKASMWLFKKEIRFYHKTIKEETGKVDKEDQFNEQVVMLNNDRYEDINKCEICGNTYELDNNNFDICDQCKVKKLA
jgi:uncharacterized membrane protein YobD (UPF0266 family)